MKAPVAGEVGAGSQEKVHMGATRMRFLSAVVRICSGRKRVGVSGEVGCRARPALLGV